MLSAEFLQKLIYFFILLNAYYHVGGIFFACYITSPMNYPYQALASMVRPSTTRISSSATPAVEFSAWQTKERTAMVLSFLSHLARPDFLTSGMSRSAKFSKDL